MSRQKKWCPPWRKKQVYKIKTTNKFEKDFAKCAKRKLDLDALGEVLEILERAGKLPRNYKPHILSGNYNGYWECHIKPDWLLIWRQNDQLKVIELVRTGTHSDLFSWFTYLSQAKGEGEKGDTNADQSFNLEL